MFSPLAIHLLPKLGKTPIADIDQTDIRDCLKPIWHTKTSVAEKALGRLSLCQRHAAALGLAADLPATDKARALLGNQCHKAENIPALPWQEVQPFYQSLDEGTVTHLALRLWIPTGVRSGPLRFLHESQIDGDVWTVPAEAMKGQGCHGGFSGAAVAGGVVGHRGGPSPCARRLLFPSVRKGVISDAPSPA